MQQPAIKKGLTDSFSELVTAIADQNLAEISIYVAIVGKRPEFDDLMQRLKKMQEKLTQKAIDLIKLYRANGGDQEEHITKECKSIIESNIQVFIKKI